MVRRHACIVGYYIQAGGHYSAQARGFGSYAELRRLVVEPALLGLESEQLPEGWPRKCFGTALGKESRFVTDCSEALCDNCTEWVVKRHLPPGTCVWPNSAYGSETRGNFSWGAVE